MQQNKIYVFDLDGVITNPEDSSVDTACVEQIYKLLDGGIFVAVNTGRSFDWVQANLIEALRGLGGHEHFSQLYIVCEKGGESLIWNDDAFRPQPSRFALNDEAIALCKQVFENAALSTMFWDATKQTMATIEKLPEASFDVFQSQQVKLLELLNEAFAGQNVRIDGTTIATDVESPSAGKHAGAELIHEWMAQHINLAEAEYICFGDSKSDYEMARYFSSQSNKTTFVFVGKQETVFDSDVNVNLVRTTNSYSDGTNEYFAQHR